METPAQNPFADVEFYVSHCPTCQAWVWMDADDQPCGKCGAMIHRRTLPYDDRKILCRDDQLEIIQQAWDIYHGVDPELGRQRREREARLEKAKDEQRAWDALLQGLRTSRRVGTAAPNTLTVAGRPQDEAWRQLERDARHRGALLRLDLLENEPLTGLPDKDLVLRLPEHFLRAHAAADGEPAVCGAALALLLRSLDALERRLLKERFPTLKPALGRPWDCLPKALAGQVARGRWKRAFEELALWRGQALALLAQAPAPPTPAESADEPAETAPDTRLAQAAQRLAALLEHGMAWEPERLEPLRPLCAPGCPDPLALARAFNGHLAGAYAQAPQPAPSPAAAAAPPAPETGEDAPVCPEDPEDTLKDLYRKVVKRCHPDLARDASQKEYRTRLTALATLARDKGNLPVLERLWREMQKLDDARN